MTAAKLVRAISTFATAVDGEEIMVHEGEQLPGNHPVLKGREELFVPVEQTTEPKRRTRRT